MRKSKSRLLGLPHWQNTAFSGKYSRRVMLVVKADNPVNRWDALVEHLETQSTLPSHPSQRVFRLEKSPQ